MLNSRPSTTAEYRPQLDGLRAIAVFGVLLHHFFHGNHLNLLAMLGVKLFFVLSGFLITGILLRSRDIREEKKQTWGFAVRQFYIRRFLRIFPLYYFVILIAVILNLEPVRQILPWLLTYTLNIYMAVQGWYVDHFAHFWSLAVEEQFYLIWPWFILFTPRKSLIPATLVFISAGPLFRFYRVLMGTNGLDTYIFTPACLDTLCLGAFLAILSHSSSSRFKENVPAILKRWVLPVAALTATALIFFNKHQSVWKWNTVFFDFFTALVFCWLVDSASRGFQGIPGAFLESKPVTYLGKISYGIYVYHPFVPHLCRFLFERYGFSYPHHEGLVFTVHLAATLLIASLSWYLLEGPVNNLKRFFKYNPDTSVKTKEKVSQRLQANEALASP